MIRDLRVYAQASEPASTTTGTARRLEVDAIVETRDGRWAAFEVKLDASRADEAAASLLSRCQGGHRRLGEPIALGVITEGRLGFTRGTASR